MVGRNGRDIGRFQPWVGNDGGGNLAGVALGSPAAGKQAIRESPLRGDAPHLRQPEPQQNPIWKSECFFLKSFTRRKRRVVTFFSEKVTEPLVP